MNNVTVIGMPGSGKSFIGEKLAERLQFKFIESDSLLEKRYGLPLRDIVETLGDNVFLDAQAKEINENTKGKEGLVISPGGSIIYSDNVMEYLKNISTIIYLENSLDKIKERISTSSRNIVGGKDKTLEQLYAERILLYKKWATVVIDGEQNSEKILSDILNIISHV